ncbi:SDR family NAD(P)-dependent oxidoreductase [Sphingomonas sp. ASY06-1R]|jgi:NAD(P)-dependent dehydrogenase (short-subunit alcohol dehydrogenase family)|uniref:SDR family NAD(P)-dependent oxidoreductase n=1 Tax=Sphingomonas sp. ASY06-1R TaxID=3445771 RepID=UPI003FA27B2D
MVSGIDGKIALVTGAAGGIGGAVAQSLAEAGAALFLIDREKPDRLAKRLGGHAVAHRCDLADPAAVEAAFAAAVAHFGRVDLLVNVAGVMIYKPIEEQSAADWQTLLTINLIAPALLTGCALRSMKQGGAIVNIASVHARRTSPLVASYAASKAALVSLTRSTAMEGKPRGIRCNAILPGAIDTPLLHASPNIRSGAEVVDPADLGQPEDIARLTIFLLSDEARFITGEDIVADGGRMGRL